MKYILICCLFFTVTSVCSQSCLELPDSFINYKEAIEAIKSTNFTFIESCNTSKSSWIRSASFHSCDSKTGFFLLKTDNQTYIHDNLPKNLWVEFTATDSFGRFYNNKIKGKYYFKI